MRAFRLQVVPALILLGSALAAQAPPAAQGQNPQDPATIKARLAQVQGRLAQVDQQMATLKKRRKGVLVEMQGIALQRDRAQAESEGAKLRRDQTEAEVLRLGQERDRMKADIVKLRGSIRHQVRWMQAVGPWGDLGFLASFRSFEDYLQRGRLLAWLRLQQRKRLRGVQDLQGSLAQREKDLQATLARLVADEKSSEALQASLRLNEEKLRGFLETLQADERQQRAVQAELSEEALQLERMLAGLLGRLPKSESFDAAVTFPSLRGDLPQPVDGSLAMGFGEHIHPRFHTKTLQSGLLIDAPAGVPVQAVADGKIVFADYYQSYGPMVILDHGGGWFTLYSHLQGLIVQKGQILKAGEALGYVGQTVDGPKLGFEIRFKTKAEDPQRWLKRKYR
ncbi:MAG: peptidoglycan DD-metalloendopeptidase family protein [Holophagaceae bacterium]|nr:peptidoglycan DD-metalloendopeptidase family protein [Holophagaceae bacterium]